MRARVLLVAMSLAAAALILVAACFPDYAYRDDPIGVDGSRADGNPGVDDASTRDATVSDGGSADALIDRATSSDGARIDFDASGMTFVEAGTFILTPSGVPQTVTHSFYMDTYEVTVGRFRAWVNANRPPPCDAGSCAIETANPYGMTWQANWTSHLTDGFYLGNGCYNDSNTDGGPLATFNRTGAENTPITCASWYEALAVCVFEKKRLPTEMEWQMAATGRGQNKMYPWGGDILSDCQHATFDFNNSGNGCGFPLPVGSARLGASVDGIFDLTGSVWEMMWDTGESFPDASTTDYAGLDAGPNIVLRGCSYTKRSSCDLRPDVSRYTPPPNQGDDTTGFRCVRTVP